METIERRNYQSQIRVSGERSGEEKRGKIGHKDRSRVESSRVVSWGDEDEDEDEDEEKEEVEVGHTELFESCNNG